MDLKEIKGLGDPTIRKLNKSGVKSVEQLALIDTRRRKVPGMDSERVIKLRRMAQKAIFLNAAQQVRVAASIARSRVERGAKSVERAARTGAQKAVKAAKMAEASASAAIEHAEKKAVTLAKQAAEQAVQARLVATQQLEALRDKISADGKDPKTRVGKYFELLERAEKAAQAAADRAVEAAGRVGQAAQQATEAGKGLYERIVKGRGK